MKTSLHQDMDARRWASEFNAVLASNNQQQIDEGWLISWFANAIMCGYDEAMRRTNRLPWYKRIFRRKSW